MGGAMSALSGREVGVDATLSVLLPPPPPRRLLVPSVAASGEVGAVDIAPAAIASWPLGSSVDECRSQEGWGLAPTEMCVEEVEVRDWQLLAMLGLARCGVLASTAAMAGFVSDLAVRAMCASLHSLPTMWHSGWLSCSRRLASRRSIAGSSTALSRGRVTEHMGELSLRTATCGEHWYHSSRRAAERVGGAPGSSET